MGDERRGLDRRTFLKGMGAVAAGGAAALPLVAAASEGGGPAVLGPGPVPFALRVDGTRHEVELEPRTTLLEALRDRLGNTGPKEVCDLGACGACTVLIDGEPRVACMTLAIDVADREVTTVRGLAGPSGEPHPLQAAFVARDALQCGFCTPGMVMACKAVLDRHPEPTADQVRDGIAGNLCRCGTYPRVVEACRTAAGLPATEEGR